jgi:hypothetical protein
MSDGSITAWRKAVANGDTMLGLDAWLDEQRKISKPSFDFKVNVDTGQALVVSSVTKLGTPVVFDLTPAFDEEDDDGDTHWCVRGGDDQDIIASVNDGIGMSILAGMKIDGSGYELSETEGDSMQFEVRQYLCRLFAAAPTMREFIYEITNTSGVPDHMQSRAWHILQRLTKDEE